MKKQYLITLVIIVVVAAGAFFGGMMYQKSHDSLAGLTGQELMEKMQSLGMSGSGFVGSRGNVNGGSFSVGDGFPGGPNSRQFGGGMINGEIVSMDSQSITVKQQDGNTTIVYYSSSTELTKNAAASTSELAVGATVRATGTTNSDDSVTAQSIQLNPSEIGNPPAQPTSTTVD